MNKSKIKISASIIAGDLTNLSKTVNELESAQVDMIHVDVMDGHFFDYIGLGYHFVKTLKRIARIPIEVHLAVLEPERIVEQFLEAGADTILVQIETSRFPLRILRRIKVMNIKSGVALLPSTPVQQIRPIINYVDQVLLLSNNDSAFLGWDDSEFLPETLERVRETRELLNLRDFGRGEIAVDGGITLKNVRDLVNSGATILVMGRSLFSGGVRETVEKIRSLIESC